MRIASGFLIAATTLFAFTTAASAAVDFTSHAFDTHGYGPGATLVWNFDGVANPEFSYSGLTFSSSEPLTALEPSGDTTNFGAGESYESAIFNVAAGQEFKSLSVYLGSLDYYNTISFYDGSTLVQSYSGNDLTDPNFASGDPNSYQTNRRFFFTFTGATDVNKVVFSSDYAAFEFDDIAAAISAVPEPATWTMMLMGFGFVGFMLRNGRRQASAIAIA